MDTGSPIGDATLAKKITDAYAHDPEGLTPEECKELTQSEEQSDALCSALGKGADGVITEQERGQFQAAGFASEFIEALAGPDGNRALQERAKWLGKHFTSSLLHTDLSKEKKIDFIAELGEIGPITPDVIDALESAMLFQQEDLPTLAARELARIGLAAVPGLMDVLDRAVEIPDLDLQEIAACALGEIGPPANDAAYLLRRLLRNDSERVRVAASVALDQIGPVPKPEISELALALKDGDPLVRKNVVRTLGLMRSEVESVFPLLMQALGDESQSVRVQAIDSIRDLGVETPEIVTALKRIIEDRNNSHNVRSAAQSLIKRFEENRTYINRIYDKDISTKDRAAYTRFLGWLSIATPQALAALGAALENDDLRESAGWSLEQLGAIAVPALMQALGDDQWRVRERAARALGYIGPDASAAVFTLRFALKDGDKDVRAQSARALGKIGIAAAEAIPDLVKVLDDRRKAVRFEVAHALGMFGPEAKLATKGLVRLLYDREDIRNEAVQSLGRLKAAAVPDLIRALADKNCDVRWGAAVALGEIGPEAKEAVPALIRAMGDEEEEVRDAAVRALGWIGPEAGAAAPGLVKLLESGDPAVRLNAASALAMMGRELDYAYAVLIKAAISFGQASEMKAAEAICVSFTRMDGATRARHLKQLEGERTKKSPMLYRALVERLNDPEFGLSKKTVPAWEDLTTRQFGGKRAITFVYSPKGEIVAEIPGRLHEFGPDSGLDLKNKIAVLDFMGRIKIVLDGPSMDIVSDVLELIRILPGEMLSDIGFERMKKNEGQWFVAGEYGVNHVKFRKPGDICVMVHELAHHWDTGKSSDKSAIFEKISWKGIDPARHLDLFDDGMWMTTPGRSDFDRDDFVREYSLYNPREDLATSVDTYVCAGRGFRERVRDEMKEGNFELAAKYLFIRYVMPFKGIQYNVKGDALGMEEVKEMYRKVKDKSKTAKGTYEIILEIEKHIPNKSAAAD